LTPLRYTRCLSFRRWIAATTLHDCSPLQGHARQTFEVEGYRALPWCASRQTFPTGTLGPKRFVRIDPGVVPIAPRKIERIPPYRVIIGDLRLAASQDRPGENRQSTAGLLPASRIIARGARTVPSKIIERVDAPMPVLPCDEQDALLPVNDDLRRVRRHCSSHCRRSASMILLDPWEPALSPDHLATGDGPEE
jgi:hypothetical protein